MSAFGSKADIALTLRRRSLSTAFAAYKPLCSLNFAEALWSATREFCLHIHSLRQPPIFARQFGPNFGPNFREGDSQLAF